jgi:hypothetical protein
MEGCARVYREFYPLSLVPSPLSLIPCPLSLVGCTRDFAGAKGQNGPARFTLVVLTPVGCAGVTTLLSHARRLVRVGGYSVFPFCLVFHTFSTAAQSCQEPPIVIHSRETNLAEPPRAAQSHPEPPRAARSRTEPTRAAQSRHKLPEAPIAA